MQTSVGARESPLLRAKFSFFINNLVTEKSIILYCVQLTLKRNQVILEQKTSMQNKYQIIHKLGKIRMKMSANIPSFHTCPCMPSLSQPQSNGLTQAEAMAIQWIQKNVKQYKLGVLVRCKCITRLQCILGQQRLTQFQSVGYRTPPRPLVRNNQNVRILVTSTQGFIFFHHKENWT